MEKYKCDFCDTEIGWEESHEEKGIIWECEECGKMVCTSCIELAGGSVSESEEKILCCDCRAKIFKENDIVKLKDKYCSKGEDEIVYIVRNVNYNTNRAYIEAINTRLSIPPQELVSFEMIEIIKGE